MNKTKFTYGGYTFEPRGTFKENGLKDDFKSLCAVLHYVNRDESATMADGDEPYQYDEFYKAAGQKEDDVFYCPETGELYVPCHCSLAVLDTVADVHAVMARRNHRRQVREEHERFIKREALKNCMCPTEEQHWAVIELIKAVKACEELGLRFAIGEDEVYAFRADLLDDLTDNMAPMKGQVEITECLHHVMHNVLYALNGLYANPKRL